MTTYNFTIDRIKPLQYAADGSGTVNFDANDFVIPAGKLPSGLPTTLSGLISQLGPTNVSIDYNVSATGMVSGYDCWRTIKLYAIGKLSDGTSSQPIQVAQDMGQSGGPIAQNWKPMFSSVNQLLTNLTSNATDEGSGSGCRFESYGGWSKTQVQVNAVVRVNLTDYCKQNPSACNITPPNGDGTVNAFKKYWWIGLIILVLLIIFIVLIIIIAKRD